MVLLALTVRLDAARIQGYQRFVIGRFGSGQCWGRAGHRVLVTSRPYGSNAQP